MDMKRHIFLASLLAMGCEPETYKAPDWDRVTTEEVRNELDNIDGTFVENTPSEILESILEETGIVYVTGIIDPIIGTKGWTESNNEQDRGALKVEEEWSEEEFATRRGALEGQAAAWIRFSCPGAALETPLLDFSKGFVQLDGDGLSYGDSSTIEGDTNLLLRFEACIAGPMKIMGSIPTFISQSTGEVAMRTDLLLEDEGQKTALQIPILYWEEGLSFTLNLNASRFAVTLPSMDLYTDPLVFRINATNGTFDCSYSNGTGDILCADSEDETRTYRSQLPFPY